MRRLLLALLASYPWPGVASAQFAAVRLDEQFSYVHAIRDGVAGGYIVDTVVDPVLWTLPVSPPNSLYSASSGGGRVLAMSATHQFGSAGGKAAIWSGTPASYMNLNPTGMVNSEILAASSAQQAGWTKAPGQDRWTATLWSGSAASAVSLAPLNSIGSKTQAMTETHQGGFVMYQGQPGEGTISHAAMWQGTASSFLDLNPPGYVGSGITGMFGDQQVGGAQAGPFGRAAMWLGTPESFRTMHPFSTGESLLNATCGSAQVGWMNSSSFGGGVRAAIWFGTAGSVHDLSQYLRPGHSQSVATCIEERNGIYTIGGYAMYDGVDQAFVWIGVPAPGTAVVMAGAGLVAIRRRRSHA
jgi:hypothetical protein